MKLYKLYNSWLGTCSFNVWPATIRINLTNGMLVESKLTTAQSIVLCSSDILLTLLHFSGTLVNSLSRTNEQSTERNDSQMFSGYW